MNITINNNYSPNMKANYVNGLKKSTIQISGGKKIFLGKKNNQFLEAFITKPAENSPHGKDGILSYFQTEYKQNGLSADDVAEFQKKVCDAISNNSIQMSCGAKLNTGMNDVKIFLTELCKALVG